MSNIFIYLSISHLPSFYLSGYVRTSAGVSEVKWSEFAQSCPTLCNPMDCSLPGSSIHGIFQAKILKWVAISFSRGSSQPRDWTWVSCTAGRLHLLSHQESQGTVGVKITKRNTDIQKQRTIKREVFLGRETENSLLFVLSFNTC